MPEPTTSSPTIHHEPPHILVAGDVCLDVVGVPIPPPPQATAVFAENWRLTGENRTFYLRGGAMLLAQMVEKTASKVTNVTSPFLPTPDALRGCISTEVLPDTLFDRLTRDEVVHSLLEADRFPVEHGQKDAKATVLRLRHVHGYSGPAEAVAPSLTPRIPKYSTLPSLVVLDDTGNQFRVDESQWPTEVLTPGPEPLMVLLKLHRPLPLGSARSESMARKDLWSTLAARHSDHLIVVLNIDDLRSAGARISLGLSWERTALDFAVELQGNETFQQLRRCRWLIARCGLDGALCWHCPDGDTSNARLWLVYDQKGIQGSYAASFPGGMTGYGSAFTAGLAAKLVGASLPRNEATIPPPLQEGIISGLSAARALLKAGFIQPKGNCLSYPLDAIGLASREARASFATIPVPLPGSVANPDGDRWTILKQVLPGGEVLDTAAQALVCTDKPTRELVEVPLGQFGDLLTYDRVEIEAYRGLSNLIREYLANPKPERPLCIAVFGPPGSGKSFGVREVTKTFSRQGTAISERVFNLSQFQKPDDLGRSLHLVRDDVIAGKVPLVFFDEFDSSVGNEKLFWLKFLLSPMQDGKFSDTGVEHLIGKAIFVFAGGTCSSFDIFSRKAGVEDQNRRVADEEFITAKGPDFISRLRGILDIPGIEHGDAYRGAAMLRRARMLRYQLWKKVPHIFDSGGNVRISSGILWAFLNVNHFEHGVRSLESLIEMCQLAGHEDFNPGCLPAPSQLRLHVTPTQTDEPGLGFLDLVHHESPFPRETREKIAEAIHEHYLEERHQKNEFNPNKPSHQEWQKLFEFYKDSNRHQADDIPRKLRLMGLDWGQAGQAGVRPVLDSFESDAELTKRLEDAAQKEHDRWLAERRLAGWTHSEKEDTERRQSPAMLEWMQLPEKQRQKDRDSIQGIPRYLKAGGYVVFSPPPPKTPPASS